MVMHLQPRLLPEDLSTPQAESVVEWNHCDCVLFHDFLPFARPVSMVGWILTLHRTTVADTIASQSPHFGRTQEELVLAV